MAGLTIGWVFGLGLILLALHMGSISLSRALRTYSRSRLEEICAKSGRPDRAQEIVHKDEKTERAAEALGVLTGLSLAALLGAVAAWTVPILTGEAIIAIALILGALGHVIAAISGRVWAEVILDSCWPLAVGLRRLMHPLTFVARRLEAMVYRHNGRQAGGSRPPSLEVEIHHAQCEDFEEEFDESHLPEATRLMIEHAVELADRVVSEIMAPRNYLVALPATASAAEAARTFTETGLSRIPLYGEHRDDVVGILYAKDLFARSIEAEPALPVSIRKLARPALFVPESKNATELLEELRRQRVQIAVVLDEYGGVSGLITLEDLLEEIVGPIDDEHDLPTPEDPVIELGNSLYEVDGSLPLEELNDRLDLALPTDGDYQTIGGLAFDNLGRVPEPGASFRAGEVEFTIVEVIDHSIRRLRLDLNPKPAVVSS